MKASRPISIAALALLAQWGMQAGHAAAPAVQTQMETVTAPQWRVGSTWDYSDGYRLRVSAVEGDVTVFERVDSPGQWFSMRGFLRQDATSGTAVRRTIYRTLDPNAGRVLTSKQPLTFQREYLSNGELIVHGSSWSVEGRQRITVPAGTFDCWVIVWRERSLQSNWTGFERWWYSPEAQTYVRMEYKYGPSATASRVLMRYSLNGPQSAPALSSLPIPAPSPQTATQAPSAAAIAIAPALSAPAPSTPAITPPPAFIPAPAALPPVAIPPAVSAVVPPLPAPAPRPPLPAAPNVSAPVPVESAPIAQSLTPPRQIAVAAAPPVSDLKEDEERSTPLAESVSAPSPPARSDVAVAAAEAAAPQAAATPSSERVPSAALGTVFPLSGTIMSMAVASLADIMRSVPAIVAEEATVEQDWSLPQEIVEAPKQLFPNNAAAITPDRQIAQAVLPDITLPIPAAAHDAPTHKPGTTTKAGMQWVVQFGSTQSEANAHRHLATLAKQTAAAELPRGIERADLGERGTFYRAWVGAYDLQADAAELCTALKSAGFDCYARLRQKPAAEVVQGTDMEWVVQIDSEKNLAGARRYAAVAQKKHATLLASLPGGIETVDFKAAGIFHRVWFGRFATEVEAASLCAALQDSGVACYARLRAADVQTAARETSSGNQ